MKRYNSDKRINTVVMTGLMMGLILVATSLFKVPVPLSQGYVHLGDGMIFLAVLLLGKRNGALAAGLGSALGDLLGGFALWVPFTFVIKFLMAYLMGVVIDLLEKHGHPLAEKFSVSSAEVLGMVLGSAEMCAGYFLVERVLYGNWAAAAVGIPWNIGQAVVGMIVAFVVAAALWKTPVKKFFLMR